jgi:hypothetical protein
MMLVGRGRSIVMLITLSFGGHGWSWVQTCQPMRAATAREGQAVEASDRLLAPYIALPERACLVPNGLLPSFYAINMGSLS